MGWQIIKQPDDLYAVFSSVVDAFVVTDATAAFVAKFFANDAAKKARMAVYEKILALEAGEKPYAQFTMTYAEAKRKHDQTAKRSGWDT